MDVIKRRDAEIGINTIFYILMALIFVWMLIFGFNKIFETKDILSEQQRVEVTQDLEKALSYCDDPLNSGSFRNFEIKSNIFNGVCVLGDDLESSRYGGYTDWVEIRDADEDVILLDTTFTKEMDGYELADYNIIDSFDLEFGSQKTICWFDKENSGEVVVGIEC